MNSLDHNSRTPTAWWKAVGLSVVALYVPFVMMGIYTALYVSHCGKAFWTIMPLAPGLVPGCLFSHEIAHWETELSLWLTTGVIDILMLAGLSFVMRRGGVWMGMAMIMTLVMSTVFAVMVLGLIRA